MIVGSPHWRGTHPSDHCWISHRLASAELGFRVHLREPQQREYEAANAEPEHDDNHLPKPKIPVSIGKVHGNGCHEVNVSNNR